MISRLHARRRRRRILTWVLVGFGALVVLAVLYLAVTALLAQKKLQHAKADLGQVNDLVSAGNISAAAALADRVRGELSDAHGLTSGPVWAAGAAVPWLGNPLEVVRGLTSATDQLGTRTLPALVRLAGVLDPAKLRLPSGAIDLAALTAAQPQLAGATADLGSSIERLDRLPADTWIAQVNVARTGLVDELSHIHGLLEASDRAARLLPTMGGSGGVRRYFMAMQNEAEMRGTGGLPGVIAIAEFDHGTLRFVRFASDTVLGPPERHGMTPTGLTLAEDYQRLYGYALPASVFPNSDIAPDFSQAAPIWAAMWQKATGQHIDGAIAVDPTALSYFLGATGPAQLPDGTTVSADNAVALTQRDLYAKFADRDQRKAYEVAVLKAVDRQLVTSPNTTAIIKAFARAVSERRLTLWSSRPAEQQQLVDANIAGTLPARGRPLSEVVINNVTGSKLDFYLHRKVRYRSVGCGPQRDVHVEVTLSNDAPAGLPAYVTIRDDHPAYRIKPGDSRVMLEYYGTGGATLQSATLDGGDVDAQHFTLDGFEVYRFVIELPREKERELLLDLREPAGTGAPELIDQPGVNPVDSRDVIDC